MRNFKGNVLHTVSLLVINNRKMMQGWGNYAKYMLYTRL